MSLFSLLGTVIFQTSASPYLLRKSLTHTFRRAAHSVSLPSPILMLSFVPPAYLLCLPLAISGQVFVFWITVKSLSSHDCIQLYSTVFLLAPSTRLVKCWSIGQFKWFKPISNMRRAWNLQEGMLLFLVPGLRTWIFWHTSCSLRDQRNKMAVPPSHLNCNGGGMLVIASWLRFVEQL